MANGNLLIENIRSFHCVENSTSHLRTWNQIVPILYYFLGF